jgi:Na+-translocating ferredoxin:NAD+ oxidoreductase RnfG subunit
VVCALLSALAPRGAPAQIRLTQQQALRLAFPEPATIERHTAFLSEEQLERARRLAGTDVSLDGRVVTYYVAAQNGEPIGIAYFDVHRVRTLPEVLMIVVTPRARVERIEVLKFSEPPEYEAPDGWLDQFVGKGLSADLSTKGSIVNITGATLTSGAVSRAVRRVLALNDVIGPLAGGEVTGRP